MQVTVDVLAGGQFGNAFALPIGGLLCAEINWDSIFYVLGKSVLSLQACVFSSGTIK